MKKIIIFVRKNPFFIAILVLAAFLRLYKIDQYMEFLGDQGRDVVIVSDFLKKANLFFIGPQTSIGNMYLGPYYYYLIAPSLLLANFSPVGPAVFVALIAVATVALVFFISHRWFDRPTALVASLLYAISPVAIKYSNFSWNPNIMPFFALLFIYFFSQAIFLKKYKDLMFTSLSFIMIINSHYLGLLLLPVVGLYWFFHLLSIKNKTKPKKQFIKYTAYSISIFLISLIPQVLFDIKHQGQNLKALIKFFSVRQTTVNLKAYKAIPNLFPLFSQITGRLLTGKNANWGLYLSPVLLIGLSVYLYRLLKNKKSSNRYLNLLIVWYFVGLIGLGLYKQHIYDHYFGFLFPPVFILMAVLINRLFTLSLAGQILGLPIALFLIYASLAQNPFLYPPNHQLQTVDKITNSIVEKSGDQNFNLALLAKQNYDPPYRYLLDQKSSRLCRLPDCLAPQLFVICEPHPDIDCQPINHPEWAVAAFGWAKIDSQWQIDGIKIFRLIPNPSGT